MNVLISACLLGQYCRYDGQVKGYRRSGGMISI